MPSLTVWLYPTAFGAGTGELHLRALAEHDAIRVHDAATIMWMPHDPAPRIRPVEHLGAKAAGRGALWGALVGLVLLNPVAGAAVGATAGAAAQRLRRTGLDPDFIEKMRDRLAPGTSALLVLSSGADPMAVRRVLHGSEAVLLHAELSDEGRRVLAEMTPEQRGATEPTEEPSDAHPDERRPTSTPTRATAEPSRPSPTPRGLRDARPENRRAEGLPTGPRSR